jgi:hypothetical protein
MGTPGAGELAQMTDLDISCHGSATCLDVTLDCMGPDCTRIEPIHSCTTWLLFARRCVQVGTPRLFFPRVAPRRSGPRRRSSRCGAVGSEPRTLPLRSSLGRVRGSRLLFLSRHRAGPDLARALRFERRAGPDLALLDARALSSRARLAQAR